MASVSRLSPVRVFNPIGKYTLGVIDDLGAAVIFFQSGVYPDI